MDKPVQFLFTDLETDGTKPNEGNQILEVSCILTDNKLNQIGKPFHSLVCPRFLHQTIDNFTPFIRNMHTENGLIKDLLKLAETDEMLRTQEEKFRVNNVEREILNWLNDLWPEGSPMAEIRMAGHSINSLDLPFIRVWMPELAGNLSHRTLDISSYVRFITDSCEIPNSDIPFGLKKAGHRAQDDNMMAITEAKKLREWIITANHLMKKAGLNNFFKNIDE